MRQKHYGKDVNMSKIAFIYPGQGAQKIGMGQDFYEQEVSVKALYDNASQWLGVDMPGLCFEENSLLDQTSYTQVAMVTTCLAMTEVIKNKGLEPDITAGLSLGEYCAIACAGGMSVEDAIKVVRKRGILMEEAVPSGEGAMSAILGLEGSIVRQVLEAISGVYVANDNCPGQVVITGTVEGVKKAESALKLAGAKRVLALNVSGPFHSPLLRGAGEKLAEVLQDIAFTELEIPYVTNVTGEYVSEIADAKELLKTQISSSVLWQQGVRNMIANGVDTFVEIGPGKTLAGFMKKIDRGVAMHNIQTLSDIDKVLEEIKKG